MPKLLKFHIKETSEYILSKSSLYFVFFFFRLNRKKKCYQFVLYNLSDL